MTSTARCSPPSPPTSASRTTSPSSKGPALAAAALIVVAAPAAPLAAQRLTATEAGLGATVAVAHHTFVGAELGLGYRPGGQSRFALALAGGGAAGRAAIRAQVSAQFLVTPAARLSPGLYAGLGAAVTGRPGSRGAGFIAVLVGVEGAPGRRGRLGGASWYVELGIGGGVRASAGWRVRWFPAWWRG